MRPLLSIGLGAVLLAASGCAANSAASEPTHPTATTQPHLAQTSPSPSDRLGLAAQLASARLATGRYATNLAAAKADGYQLITPMIPDMVGWSLPQDFQATSDPPGFSAHFSEPPAQRCVLTLVFSANAWDGAVGHISFVGTVNADIPIAGGWANHTVDISTVPPAAGVHTWANLRPGLHTVNFTSITLQAQRVILDPTIG